MKSNVIYDVLGRYEPCCVEYVAKLGIMSWHHVLLKLVNSLRPVTHIGRGKHDTRIGSNCIACTAAAWHALMLVIIIIIETVIRQVAGIAHSRVFGCIYATLSHQGRLAMEAFWAGR